MCALESRRSVEVEAFLVRNNYSNERNCTAVVVEFVNYATGGMVSARLN